MGNVYKKTATRPIPADAETFIRKGEALARWRDKAGRKHEARVTADGRGVLVESAFWTALYRDAAGVRREVSTGAKDRATAMHKLAQLEATVARIRAGIVTEAEIAAAAHGADKVADAVAAYEAHLAARGRTPNHCKDTGRRLTAIANGCGWRTVRDLNARQAEAWLNDRRETPRKRKDGTAKLPVGARTLNRDSTLLKSFGKWLFQSGRATANAFERLPLLNVATDRRHQRRALSEAELLALLDAARRRPLETRLSNRGGAAELKEVTRSKLELLGKERALIYKVLVLTGLRRGELASVTVGGLHLDGSKPYIALAAKDEKARRGAQIPLRADLAAELAQWLGDKLTALRTHATRTDAPVPMRLLADAPLFTVPEMLCKILARDLTFAGVAKEDERGRVADVHSLRLTFGTHLARAGVPLVTTQKLMRHSDPRLTASVYTDAHLLDLHGAVSALPALTFEAAPDARADTGAEG